MALSRPQRDDEHLPTGGALPAPLSLVGAHHEAPRSDAVWFTVCAWCERVKVRGRWVADRPLVDLLMGRTSGAEPAGQVTHGICEPCFAAVSARAARARDLRRATP